ncbi:hypothetical protein B0T11DRAFT_293895 [Plectosphaerella cucumerina]|uniref:Uncharacterized protein n=1 Tax=Plectosphaerella cucumerina TaxID=40658 RepID=A0A8K0XA30_9PEZI|nr:hypothetical protein B0T11DRAFT_293895 [Plectosphaerella cucumerina]
MGHPCPIGYIPAAVYQKTIIVAEHRVLICCLNLRNSDSLVCTVDPKQTGQAMPPSVVPALIVREVIIRGGAATGLFVPDGEIRRLSDLYPDELPLLSRHNPRSYKVEDPNDPIIRRSSQARNIAIFSGLGMLVLILIVAMCFCWPSRFKSTWVNGARRPTRPRRAQRRDGEELGYMPGQRAYGMPLMLLPSARYA